MFWPKGGVGSLTRRAFICGAAACATAGPAGAQLAFPDLPAEPAVVALEFTPVENLLALGLVPAGVADIEGYRTYVGYRGEMLETAVDVGTRQEPSIERLASLSPDLIIGVAFRHAPHRDRLERIAPTLMVEGTSPPGIGMLSFQVQEFERLAAALGRQEQGRRAIDDMENVFASAAKELASTGLEGAPVVLMQFLPGAAQFRVFGDGSLPTEVAENLNLKNAWTHETNEWGFTSVGPEALAAIGEAHVLIVGPENDPTFQRLTNNPVWNALPFVSSDKVGFLPDDTWFFGGPASAARMAEAITTALVRQASSRSSFEQ